MHSHVHAHVHALIVCNLTMFEKLNAETITFYSSLRETFKTS